MHFGLFFIPNYYSYSTISDFSCLISQYEINVQILAHVSISSGRNKGSISFLFLNEYKFPILKWIMPIINVSLFSGRNQREKDRLAEAITESTCRILKIDKKEVIIVFQEEPHGNWYSEGVRIWILFLKARNNQITLWKRNWR